MWGVKYEGNIPSANNMILNAIKYFTKVTNVLRIIRMAIPLIHHGHKDSGEVSVGLRAMVKI